MSRNTERQGAPEPAPCSSLGRMRFTVGFSSVRTPVFVKNHSVGSSAEFKRLRGSEKHPFFCAFSGSCRKDGGNGQAQRAGAGKDQHRNARFQRRFKILGNEKPDGGRDEGNRQNGGQKKAGRFVRRPDCRRFGSISSLGKRLYAGKAGAVCRPSNQKFQISGSIQGSGGDEFALLEVFGRLFPVREDSSKQPLPSSILPSAGTESPGRRRTVSPSCNWSEGMTVSRPPRKTVTSVFSGTDSASKASPTFLEMRASRYFPTAPRVRIVPASAKYSVKSVFPSKRILLRRTQNTQGRHWLRER